MLNSSSTVTHTIRKLSSLVANQIAAGEVVERPASVVKELLENSIDAGASRIQVDVERGGTRLIRITDDGCGISREQLELALSRHATSKIEHSDDLKAIHTLGFRGEALASISSVSRLTLSSKPDTQEMGWSAMAEGLDMQVQLQPTSIPNGTIVEVKDLFFNTPARQKFLRAERTEYVHIEETIKRVALASPQVAITLKHNGKVTKRIPAAVNLEQQKQRIGSIVGNQFIRHALRLDCGFEHLQLQGWISPLHQHQNSSMSQYVFVNGRAVKDRTLNHAIRQAYHQLLPAGRAPTYVLYLTLDAEKVDVNVHPTKHEVRFSDARMVHDFIEKMVRQCVSEKHKLLTSEALNEQSYEDIERYIFPAPETSLTSNANIQDEYYHPRLKAGVIHQINERSAQYSSVASSAGYKPSSGSQTGTLLIDDRMLLFTHEKQAYCLDLKGFVCQWITDYLTKQWQQASVKQKPLLIPARLGMPIDDIEQSQIDVFQQLGFEITQTSPKTLALRRIPSCIEHIDVGHWLQQSIYTFIDKQFGFEQWQDTLLASLENYWQPESKTQWHNWLQPLNWKDSRFCKVLSAEILSKL
ncbi:MAG: DNA mismatch repair endonuclease MutL [Kangiellaceae bacterium]|nr:DNA mismatch repair endonuclease MutL [Kangiellaceae bacterium]